MNKGERACFDLLSRYQRQYGRGSVYIRQSRIAKELGFSEVWVRKCVLSLRRMGAVTMTRAARNAASDYAVNWDYHQYRSSCEKYRSEYRSRVSVTPAPSLYNGEEQQEQVLTGVEEETKISQEVVSVIVEQTEGMEVGGKSIDTGTVRRLAGLVKTLEGWEVLCEQYKRWKRNSRPRSWGILVELARHLPSRKPPQTEIILSPAEQKEMAVWEETREQRWRDLLNAERRQAIAG